MPFLCVSAAVRNDTDEPMTVEQITPLWAKVDVGTPADGLRGFAPEGPVKLGDKTHFCFAAAVDPQTNSGVVCGWLSHYRGSGVVRIAVDGAALELRVALRVRPAAGACPCDGRGRNRGHRLLPQRIGRPGGLRRRLREGPSRQAPRPCAVGLLHVVPCRRLQSRADRRAGRLLRPGD